EPALRFGDLTDRPSECIKVSAGKIFAAKTNLAEVGIKIHGAGPAWNDSSGVAFTSIVAGGAEFPFRLLVRTRGRSAPRQTRLCCGCARSLTCKIRRHELILSIRKVTCDRGEDSSDRADLTE